MFKRGCASQLLGAEHAVFAKDDAYALHIIHGPGLTRPPYGEIRGWVNHHGHTVLQTTYLVIGGLPVSAHLSLIAEHRLVVHNVLNDQVGLYLYLCALRRDEDFADGDFLGFLFRRRRGGVPL